MCLFPPCFCPQVNNASTTCTADKIAAATAEMSTLYAGFGLINARINCLLPKTVGLHTDIAMIDAYADRLLEESNAMCSYSGDDSDSDSNNNNVSDRRQALHCDETARHGTAQGTAQRRAQHSTSQRSTAQHSSTMAHCCHPADLLTDCMFTLRSAGVQQ
jgi:hypothetical protein